MRIAAVSLAVLPLAAAAAAPAGEREEPKPAVGRIVENANRVAYYQGRDGKAEVTMTITDGQKRKRKREFSILRWDAPDPGKKDEKAKEAGRPDDSYCGDQKFYVYFHKPADVNKMVFMVWKHLAGDDDRWLYTPGLDLVNRIAASDERTSFVGSDFLYEDVSGRGIDEDRHEMLETNENYHVLKSTPRNPAKVEFAHYKMWIHRTSFVMVKAEYYDAKGEKYREYQALGVKNIQGYPTVTKSVMRDLRTGSETTLEYDGVEYDTGLPESVFTERYLKRKPRRYLK